MRPHPFDVTSSVLAAAAAGETVPGFEAVGALLVDLGRVTPLEPGVALRASAVAAATTTSRQAMGAAPFRWLRPAMIAAAIGAAGVAGFITVGASAPSTLDVGPGGSTPSSDRGVERLVSDEDDRPADDVVEVTSSTSPGATLAPGDGSIPASGASTPSSQGVAPAGTTSPPTTTEPGEPTTSTTSTTVGPPTPTSDPPVTSTTIATTTTTEQHGNNGNGNGNGTGNGKGNQGGNGNGGGNGGGSGNGGGNGPGGE